MMMTMNLIIIFGMLHVGLHPVVSLNTRLSHLEADVLYSHLKNQTNLELFYEKLIKSNGVDDPTHVHRSITEDDIRQGIIEHKCFKSTDDLLNAFDIRPINENISLTRTDVQRLFPVLIDIKFNGGCQKSHGFAMWKNILIGLIAVSVLNCSALFGAIILPFHKKPAFKWILSSFIGLAVGTLIGTGIFHLIPMAFNVPHFDTDHAYLNKALITIIVIYLFFIRDQLFKIFFNIEAIGTHNHNDSDDALSPFQKKNSKNLWHNLKTMKAAGWMILISDMLHCFIDGITLGAVSMVSISEGLRMLLPIICEEFPHKLGDIAVLLSSGLTNGQALIMCFLSACCSYPGFLIGAKLGELEEFHRWIYAFAGGMFVYIGLADMVPELVSIGAEIEKNYADINRAVRTKLRLKILICQNIGVTLGIGIMFALAKYDELLFGTSH